MATRAPARAGTPRGRRPAQQLLDRAARRRVSRHRSERAAEIRGQARARRRVAQQRRGGRTGALDRELEAATPGERASAGRRQSGRARTEEARAGAGEEGRGRCRDQGDREGSSGEDVPAKDAAPISQPAPKAAPPRPESTKPPPVEAVTAKPLIAIPDDRPPPPPVRIGMPRYSVQSKREEPPTARSPLNYREYVFVVPEGTSEDDAERLIRDLFVDVKKSLATLRAGKLVNLAVFDHAYVGKPKRPPLVTLAWKDWRGDEPEVRVPSREPGETPTPLARRPLTSRLRRSRARRPRSRDRRRRSRRRLLPSRRRPLPSRRRRPAPSPSRLRPT